MNMSKGTVAASLREEAMARAGSDPELAKLLLKAATWCDELRIEREVTERMMVEFKRTAHDVQIIENVGRELIGLREELKRYRREVAELATKLEASP